MAPFQHVNLDFTLTLRLKVLIRDWSLFTGRDGGYKRGEVGVKSKYISLQKRSGRCFNHADGEWEGGFVQHVLR